MRVARVSDINKAKSSIEMTKLKAEIKSLKLRVKTLEQNAGITFTPTPVEYIGKFDEDKDSKSNG